jgi:ATP-dependent RNA helicase DeaD
MTLFSDLGLSEATLKALSNKGFSSPTPIQMKAIPALLENSTDIVAQAQTGTGKTAAFGLPLIELLEPGRHPVQAIILAPTRELANQVAQEIRSLCGVKKLRVLPVYGGQPMDRQLHEIRKGVDIIVGTPGRVLDHLKRKSLRLDTISHFILDEADEMLNMGFLEDVREIMAHCPEEKRTMLFSATMPKEILSIAREHMGNYDVIRTESSQLTTSDTRQIFYEVAMADKFEALCRILDMEEGFYGLIFCKTRADVDAVAQRLAERGHAADGLHGDMSQMIREKILQKFRRGQISALVATDVAARGIDIQNLTHVVNFALPFDTESYVHRIGRTGRAGKQGKAISLITPREVRRIQNIARTTRTDIARERLPSVKDLVRSKKTRLCSELEALIEAGPNRSHMQLAQEILENSDPQAALAAVLQRSFKGDLDESRYVEIREPRQPSQRGREMKLFMGRGRKDGFTPKKMHDFIVRSSGISGRKIRDIQVRDACTFITLPVFEADKVLNCFKSGKNGAPPLVTKARPQRKWSGPAASR